MNTPNNSQSWKDTIKVLWFGESADQTKGALPAIAVDYKGLVGSRYNLLLSSAHAVLDRFQSNLIVTLGTFAGLDKETGWLPNNHPCGGVRNNLYPIIDHAISRDLFIGTLCRDLPPEAVCQPAPPSKPGDKVEWWSVARRLWVQSTVLAVDNLGRITCEGTLAISQDSGSLAFTPDGKFIGAVSERVNEYNGRRIDGCLLVTFVQTTITPPTPIPPTHPTTTTPFEGLYAEAKHVQERITLLTLAKLYHIRKQNFAEAARYRDLEKSLKEEVENAINNLGKSAVINP